MVVSESLAATVMAKGENANIYPKAFQLSSSIHLLSTSLFFIRACKAPLVHSTEWDESVKVSKLS